VFYCIVKISISGNFFVYDIMLIMYWLKNQLINFAKYYRSLIIFKNETLNLQFICMQCTSVAVKCSFHFGAKHIHKLRWCILLVGQHMLSEAIFD